MILHMGLIFDYHKYLTNLFIYNLLNQMLKSQTVIHCRTLQDQVSFWFTSALIKFPPKHSCNPNNGGEKDHGG